MQPLSLILAAALPMASSAAFAPGIVRSESPPMYASSVLRWSWSDPFRFFQDILEMGFLNNKTTTAKITTACASIPTLVLLIYRGWRSWNFFQCDISQKQIQSQVDSIVTPRNIVTGVASDTDTSNTTISLLELGYLHVGLDDCTQQFHASYMPGHLYVYHAVLFARLIHTTCLSN